MKAAPITVAEAQSRLAAEVPAPQVEETALAAAAGFVLAQDVASDVDLPPFDRAAMDGYAVIAADTPGALEVTEVIAAGEVPRRAIARGRCARIMTGAPLPEGADAVQQHEKTDNGRGMVRVHEAVRPGQNVTARGADVARGSIVLKRGTRVRASELGLLAAVGPARLAVYRRPTCATFATGDELVEPPATPGPGQIRNSNAHALAAQAREAGVTCDVLPIARDTSEEIRARVREGLSRDVLIISGGVSAGDRDFVAEALEAEGVRCVVHQVLLRPGRPFYFGRRERQVVFGLPGNPVSSFVTFEVFVKPFLSRMMGAEPPGRLRMRLSEPLPGLHEREQYLPARAKGDTVRALPWGGSSDLLALSKANALLVQPIKTALAAGDSVEVLPL